MPTNRYFNEFRNKSEQKLLDNLLTECIAMHGIDCYYIPKSFVKKDEIFGEDVLLEYKDKFPIEMYMESTEDFTSNDNLISKFGLDIKDDVNVIVSRRTFQQRVPQNSFQRPREGDLIYIPFLNGTGELFEIKFTNQTKIIIFIHKVIMGKIRGIIKFRSR